LTSHQFKIQAIGIFDKMTALNFKKCHNDTTTYNFYSKMAEKLEWNNG